MVPKLFETYRHDQRTGGRNQFGKMREESLNRKIQTSQMVYRDAAGTTPGYHNAATTNSDISQA